MTRDGEDGYILAAALAMLLALSLVAAALVSVSVEGLRRVKRTETQAQTASVLRSAILVVGSQLPLDPRHRQLSFPEGKATVDIAGLAVEIAVGWETAKLDVNAADPEEVLSALTAANVATASRDAFMKALRQKRASDQRVETLDDLLPASPDLGCLRSILTIFAGRTRFETVPVNVDIGQPTPGSRLTIEARLPGERAAGRQALVLMTGDPAAPAKIMDTRPLRDNPEEACDADPT